MDFNQSVETTKEVDAGLVVAGSPSTVIEALRVFKLMPTAAQEN